MADLDLMEKGRQDEDGSLVHDSTELNNNREGEEVEGDQEVVNDGEPGFNIPLIVMREDEDEPHRKTFYKVVEIFGDKLNPRSSAHPLSVLDGIYNNTVGRLEEDEPDNVDKTKNKINLMKLNSVIERLENPINPLSVMNRSNRTTVVRNRVNAMALEVEHEGFLNEGEFLALHRKQENRVTELSEREALNTEKKILNYVQKIADAKKLLKWPPPRFSLILIIVHLFLFFVTSSEGGRSVLTDLQFDP